MMSAVFGELSEDEKFEEWRKKIVELWTSYVLKPETWTIKISLGCVECCGWDWEPRDEEGLRRCLWCESLVFVDKSLPDGKTRVSVVNPIVMGTFAEHVLSASRR